MSEVILPRTLINQLLEHAQRSAESEVCGLVSSKAGKPAHCYPIANVADDVAHYFEMDPKGQIEAMRTMREQGEDLFAIYHSHPSSPAQPSGTDLQHDDYPEALSLIISLNTEGVLELQGFSTRGGELVSVDLALE